MSFLLVVVLLWLVALYWAWRRHNHHPNTNDFHRDLLAAGALVLATLAFFWRMVSGDVFQPADGGDLVSFLFPTYRFAAGEIQRGALPLWNPTLYGGAPFIGDIQAGFLYPPNLLLFWFNPNFGYRTMQWLVLGHICWAGLGMYVLLRTLQWPRTAISRPAAFFGALAFMFCDPILVHLGNLNLIAVLSWLPWLLAAYQRGLNGNSEGIWIDAADEQTHDNMDENVDVNIDDNLVREVDQSEQETRPADRTISHAPNRYIWLAVASALFAVANYAGHAQSSLYLGLTLAVYTLGWSLVQWSSRRWRALLAGGWRLALVATLTLMLSAPILLPALELTAYTERSEFDYQDTTAFSLAPTQLLGILTPGFFGRGPALHWSLWDRVETPYAGVATVLLALGALLMASRQVRRRLLPWALLAAVGLLVSLGVYAIVHGWLTLLLPPLAQMRAPARSLILWNTALAVLAAMGVDLLIRFGQDVLASAGGIHWRNVMGRGAQLWFAIILPLGYLTLLLTQDNETTFLRASVALLALVFAALWWLAAWLVVEGMAAAWWSSRVAAILLVALLYLDLAAAGAYTDVSPVDPTTGFQHAAIVDFLRADMNGDTPENGGERFRIDTRTDIQALWQPDTAALYGFEDVGGIVNPLSLRQWQQQWEATGGRATRAYDMLNVKYVLVRDRTPLPEGKFELAFDAEGELSLYRNLNAMPRAWVVHSAILATNVENALEQIQAPDFDPLAAVIVLDNHELQGATPFGPLIEPPAPGTSQATVHASSNSSLTIAVDAAAPGFLVLSELWYPGWQATVHGTERTTEHAVIHANGSLRAVPIPAGRSTVEMRFRPATWRWGQALAGIGLVAVAVLILGEQRRRRRQNLEEATGRIPAR